MPGAEPSMPMRAPPLADLWSYEGPPTGFWPLYLSAAAAQVDATAAWVLMRDRRVPDVWKKLAPWPSETDAAPLSEAGASIAESCLLNGSASRPLVRAPGVRQAPLALAVPLQVAEADTDCVALFLIPNPSAVNIEEAVRTLSLLAPAPAAYQQRLALRQARSDVARFSSVLDLLTTVSPARRFVAMAMAFVNELAARHRCDKVSLGWLENDGYAHVQAISHTERFERKMEAIKKIEYAMEEALDQDDEILWPAPPESVGVAREHEACATSRGVAYLCTVPLRVDGKPVAAVTCERQSAPFEETDLRLLRLSCDMVTPRLADLKRRDRWFGARFGLWAKESLARLVGVEHTGAKLAALAVALLLGVLLFGRMPFRVEGTCILRAEHVVSVPAVFDGYISDVLVEVGDLVTVQQELLHLDTRDLLLEEASAAADHQRFVREAEKARADQRLADMQIALALSEQARARLDLVRYRLEQSRIRTPFDGIVVDGDLRERIGSPVRIGEPLFRVSRLDQLYVHLEVDESLVHELEPGMTGRIALVSQPNLKFPVRVLRVDPIAVARERQNVFSVRCEVLGDPPDWWRPGMSGIGKIDVDRRNILWIFTRRTIDFIRLRFWW